MGVYAVTGAGLVESAQGEKYGSVTTDLKLLKTSPVSVVSCQGQVLVFWTVSGSSWRST